MKMNAIRLGVVAALLFPVGASYALDYQFDDLNITINNRLTSGVALRMQQPSNDLLGKTNVPGQSNLCNADSCIYLGDNHGEGPGSGTPNQRLVDAAGSFSAINDDNGNINYKRYDIVNAVNRLSTDAVFKYGDWLARVRAIGFYDPVNTGFKEHHNDTRFQPESTDRTDKVERIYAMGVDLYDAYVSHEFKWGGDRHATISVGQQTVRWGESTLIARNAIAEINSPSAVVLHTPGFEINEVFKPVAAIVLSTDLFEGVSGELFYQLKWQKIQPDPNGSFFGDRDLLEGTYAAISLGQAGEDPYKRQRFNGPIALVSSSSATAYLSDPKEPKDMGQVGFKINYSADWLNGGTELGFYFLNYHSRYPYATALATDASCTRGVGPDGVTNDTQQPNSAQATAACQGYNGELLGRQNEHNRDREPLPIDTFKAYLEYPENIQMYGLSFNTNALGLSLAGEYSFRPNMPLQVSITDVIFTALQPAFPANNFDIAPNGLGPVIAQLGAINNNNPLGVSLVDPRLSALGAAHFPGANTAVPSFLKAYRGYGAIQPHQVIPGYERFAVGQGDLTAIKIFSTNPFGADQIIVIGEVGFTQIFGLPDTSQLQIEGGGPNASHAGPGQDTNTTNYARLNPHQQTDGFADSFSWGLRSIIQSEYNDVVFGWSLKPQIILQWDVGGVAPFPIQNFVEGRKQFDFGTTINMTQALSARINYEIYTGGGTLNTYRDRDNMALSVAYSF
jgi:hypothetical protein